MKCHLPFDGLRKREFLPETFLKPPFGLFHCKPISDGLFTSDTFIFFSVFGGSWLIAFRKPNEIFEGLAWSYVKWAPVQQHLFWWYQLEEGKRRTRHGEKHLKSFKKISFKRCIENYCGLLPQRQMTQTGSIFQTERLQANPFAISRTNRHESFKQKQKQKPK